MYLHLNSFTIFPYRKKKNVLRGGLDADICSSERYQPWPIKFYTNISTNCIFLKSVCNEEGQVVYGEGNRNTDTTCRCDYTSGYNFLVKPRHICFCVPSEEDCSCYLKTCPDSSFKLAPDYECIQLRINTSMSQCRPVVNGSVNSNEHQSIIQYVPRENNISASVTWKTFAGISTLFCSIGMLIFVCITKYYHKVYFMDQQSNVELPIVFLKNNVIITKASHIKEKRVGRSMILQIDHVTVKDNGEYCLNIACIKSNPTQLTVKPLFKRSLENVSILEGSETIFECQTEEENSLVEWFKEGDKVTNNIQNVKMETLPGHIYRLTISQTRLSDCGKYKIKKDGVNSKATLEVKALFKRSLENVSILEGSETIFECQTEEESSPVEWFKEGDKVTNNIQNVKMETLPGHIYRLTISQTRLSDCGKYKIKKDGVNSKATLEVKALFKRPLENIKSVEGSDAIFECETEKENSDVEWFKDDVKMTYNTEKLETEQGYIYKLTIKHACVQDSGIYRIEKNCIRSEAVLQVKEKENSDVEWFKDDVKMTYNTEKLETEQGYIYKLTIKHAGVQDSGTYRIEKNCIRSEAVLQVKALFKRPLENIKSLEGSDAIFECVTEKENSDVEWFKDDVKMTYNTEKLETEQGYIYKLTIKHAGVQDSGTYRIEKNCIRSEAVLQVKALFKRPLENIKSVEGSDAIFECVTEKENSDVEWFKDDVKMTYNTEKLETEQGYIYKLTIKHAGVQDSGTYRIEKNCIRSEAVLQVKDQWFNNKPSLTPFMKPTLDLKTIKMIDVLLSKFFLHTFVENKGCRKCNFCKNMSLYKCYDCKYFLCKDCSRKHNDENKYQSHLMQLISDSFILNCKFSVEDDIHGERLISDIKCLPNGEIVLVVKSNQVITFSVSGKQRHVIQLEEHSSVMDVVDKNTVAVLLEKKRNVNYSVAIVDIQQIHVQYIRDIAVKCCLGSFIYVENQLYVSDLFGITVINMSGDVNRRFDLSFTPYDMCYDVNSQRIYCIHSDNSELVCIGRDGNNIFTFVDPNLKNLGGLDIDNEGNVFVLCKNADDDFGCVIKVDSDGKSSDVVITNIQLSEFYQDSCICFQLLTNSVVIGTYQTVYIYKKKENV
ncbi:unnamed protein product [Mytilus coruscus]|uniref:Ig-like domain-containing protein n=1 Tax=Mytilus coruscus TaxID=42192 RepID=A0A6J8C5F8_MYTCO|nr:unnamed protein product [Mytilus coruscus]